ncbi:uncharacterized protein LAESUDRAFT_808323 [Laetiporus sulphureus 93-53]|uniref:Pentacotripeptide-repeat region of PRORP domain-containing protein n=1 Tax=Laetiporus sulphureus 93-53 TaxID=1314785 RepID=A0A165I9T5_9APHY|nr:uncharacterized protein LAESUDRAFT_808323 [Laetiporus sulphureus 93-53]KZT12781.1 hypothetical protein LAESUDRAFT_808323 [Laetiporus sulphureus 93-53]
MLRVSSLGLKRCHATPRYHSTRPCRSVAVAPSRKSDNECLPNDSIDGKDTKRNDVLRESKPVHGNATSSTVLTRTVIPPLEWPQRKPFVSRRARTTFFANKDAFFSTPPSPPSIAAWDDNVEPPAHISAHSGRVNLDASPALSSAQGSDKDLERIMATTSSGEEAWAAYQKLLASPHRTSPIPYALLHRLARILASSRTRTRPLFLRLLSVLSTLHTSGGTVQLWDWNALIDCAGKGWRKTRLEDLQAALDVYRDMIAQNAPGATFSGQHRRPPSPSPSPGPNINRPAIKPDTVTLTTLVNIAGRTLDQSSLRYALKLFESSGLTRNRITYLALVRYFTRKNDLVGVRDTLHNMRGDGFELDIDGLNACIWAFARNGHMNLAGLVYRIIRHHHLPEDETEYNSIDAAKQQLARMEGITIPDDVKSDAITFYTLIQCYAYHGDLVQSLEVFRDMMLLNEKYNFSNDSHKPNPAFAEEPSSTLPAFRAIFLGFARHGEARTLKEDQTLSRHLKRSQWTMANLDALFDSFLTLTHESKPSERTIYWILVAFKRLSGRDKPKLQRVWQKLEDKFGGGWGGRLERFRKRIHDE